MMKYFVLILIGGFLLMLNSCNGRKSYDYSIDRLKKDKIQYNQLPVEIQKYLLDASSYNLTSLNDTDFEAYYFMCLDSVSVYEVETVNTIIGPWVDYTKLKDNKNSISYKIDQDMPTPYIVFNKKLYVPQDFNVLPKVKTSKDLFFHCYYLKK